MNWEIAASIIALIFSTVVIKTYSIRCYVCGSDVNSLSCEEFEKSEGASLEKFIIDCPQSNRGCMAQKHGNTISRSCDLIALNDCQSANGVTYCYCSEDLCNAPGAIKLSTTSAAYVELTKISELTDDEDYVDMSGDGLPADTIENSETDRIVDNDRAFVIKGKIDTFDKIDENESEKYAPTTTIMVEITKISTTDSPIVSIQLAAANIPNATKDKVTQIFTTITSTTLDDFTTMVTTADSIITTPNVRHVEQTKKASMRRPSTSNRCAVSISTNKVINLLSIGFMVYLFRF